MDHLTLPRYLALSRYWSDHPPIHLMVAAYLGIKPRPKQSETDAAEFFQAVTGMLPPGF